VLWCEDDALTARGDARRDARRWEGKGGLPIQAGGVVIDFKRLSAAVGIPISMLDYLNYAHHIIGPEKKNPSQSYLPLAFPSFPFMTLALMLLLLPVPLAGGGGAPVSAEALALLRGVLRLLEGTITGHFFAAESSLSSSLRSLRGVTTVVGGRGWSRVPT